MSARRALAPRSIHLRIAPRPANLSESREIFRVLQRFGEVSTFKYLRYEYQNPADNVAFAIFRDESAAQRALDASPIRFALEKVGLEKGEGEEVQGSFAGEENDYGDDALDIQTTTPPADHGINDILRPSHLLTRTRPATDSSTPSSPPTTTASSLPFDPPPPRSPLPQRAWTKWFQVTVDRSRVVHQDFIERQPYWKYFDPMRSMAQADLEKRVPHIGLSDVSKRSPNAHRTPNRVLKIMNEYVEKKMPTLRGMAENGVSERRFRERRGL